MNSLKMYMSADNIWCYDVEKVTNHHLNWRWPTHETHWARKVRIFFHMWLSRDVNFILHEHTCHLTMSYLFGKQVYIIYTYNMFVNSIPPFPAPAPPCDANSWGNLSTDYLRTQRSNILLAICMEKPSGFSTQKASNMWTTFLGFSSHVVLVSGVRHCLPGGGHLILPSGGGSLFEDIAYPSWVGC